MIEIRAIAKAKPAVESEAEPGVEQASTAAPGPPQLADGHTPPPVPGEPLSGRVPPLFPPGPPPVVSSPDAGVPVFVTETNGHPDPPVRGGGRSRQKRTAVVLTAASLVVMAGVVVVFLLMYPSGDAKRESTTARSDPAADVQPPSAVEESLHDDVEAAEEASAAAGSSVFLVHWPEQLRDDATAEIDGRRLEVRRSGPVRYPVEPGGHRVVLRREGYAPIEYRFFVEAGEEHAFEPNWAKAVEPGPVGALTEKKSQVAGGEAPSGSFDAWLQDPEEALWRARKQGKDVLFLFSGSDWCPPCQRFAEQTLWQPGFMEQVGADYVPVHLDFPRSAAGQAKVDDRVRNDRLKLRYDISSLPTIVLTDASGEPFAMIAGSVPGGVSGLMEQLQRRQSVRRQCQDLFREIDGTNDPHGRRKAIAAVAELLRDNGMLQFYRDRLEASAGGTQAGSRSIGGGLDAAEAEPDDDEIALSDEDLADPVMALATLGLSKAQGALCLEDDLEFCRLMGEADAMRRKAFLASRKAEEAQQKVEQKQQLIQSMLLQRMQLRAQLARSGSFDTATMINELGDRIVMLQNSTEPEDQAEMARGEANTAAEQYVEQLLAARRLHDRAEEQYARLTENGQVRSVVDKYNAKEGSSVELGPSRRFLSDARRLGRLEEGIVSERIPLRRGAGGLWHVTVMLNGRHAQEMAIDTGASVVALPWAVAQQAGLTPTANDPTMQIQVADGRVLQAKRVIAKTVRVGKFVAKDVECTVLPPEYAQADCLLGLSFLQHFSFKVDAAAGKLIMSQIQGGSASGR